MRLTFLSQARPDTEPVIPTALDSTAIKLPPALSTLAGVVPPAAPLTASTIPALPRKRGIHAEVGRYRLRLAEGAEDCEAACRLRFKVFNIELGEGLESSYQTGLDTDQFDSCCEHLLVEDKQSRKVVGTYRMQSGATAAARFGYYSEQEFSLAPYEPLRAEILELGRASIDREHRTPEVLTLLWRGIAQYATDMGLRYLLGCSSLNSQDPVLGWKMFDQLGHYRVSPEFMTTTTEAFACPIEPLQESAQNGACTVNEEACEPVKVPKLLKTYLAIGARIAAPPAWDREFGTIDFLTLLDLRTMSTAARNRFLAPLER